jgi:hypothetical protein
MTVYAVRLTHSVPIAGPGPGPNALQSEELEFRESVAVNLEWKMSGMKEMYNSTKGEAKSWVMDAGDCSPDRQLC